MLFAFKPEVALLACDRFVSCQAPVLLSLLSEYHYQGSFLGDARCFFDHAMEAPARPLLLSFQLPHLPRLLLALGRSTSSRQQAGRSLVSAQPAGCQLSAKPWL